jgi:hypothetical protein
MKTPRPSFSSQRPSIHHGIDASPSTKIEIADAEFTPLRDLECVFQSVPRVVFEERIVDVVKYVRHGLRIDGLWAG